MLKSFDPSNGNLVGEVEITDSAAIQAIVNAAHLAQPAWAKIPVHERVRLLEAVYDKIQPHSRELAAVLSQEMGKSYSRAMGEVRGASMSGAYLAQSAAEAFKTRQLHGGDQLQYRPLGVVAVISPWNYPVMMANNLVVPALIAGNSVVFKPSEETPIIAREFFGYLESALPEGVFTIIYGDRETGKRLVESDINMVAFTGSMAAGKDIVARSAPGMKRLVMELGGNDPMIVLNDANLERAARFAVGSAYENAGQMCTSTERIYVDERIADRFEQKVVEIAKTYKSGPWNDPQADVGPIINASQHAKVLSHIQDAVDRGANLLLGNPHSQLPYVEPAVLTGLNEQMLMEHEETFGPVVAISQFTDLNEAIRRANDSNYGLGAVVFGGKQARDVAEQLEAGMVAINQSPGGAGDAPWVGAKQSGFGFHGSADGHRQFAQVRLISE